jgi:hypothetical protein
VELRQQANELSEALQQIQMRIAKLEEEFGSDTSPDTGEA